MMMGSGSRGNVSLLGKSGASAVRIDDGDGQQLRAAKELVRKLGSSSHDDQRSATADLRRLSKENMRVRILIAASGAIPPLVSLLQSTDPQIQENAVAALSHLSKNPNNRPEIADAKPFGPLIHILNVGTAEAKEYAAATLHSLSDTDENKMAIGQQSGAIDALVDLLRHGSLYGKRNAATALQDLSILHENRIRIVRADAVKPLLRLISDPASGMVDKAVAVISNLATITEGRTSIDEDEGILALVEVVEFGSQCGQQSATEALLHFCSKGFSSKVVDEGVVPALFALVRSGTPTAKEKAITLLQLLRDQQRQEISGDLHGEDGR